MMAFPKPERAKPDPAYLAQVRQLPCVCCQRFPSEAHHPISGRFSQRKAPDRDAIPLCNRCHRLRHSHPEMWERAYGDDRAYSEPTREAVRKIKRETRGGR
jgi:hypothetical protein